MKFGEDYLKKSEQIQVWLHFEKSTKNCLVKFTFVFDTFLKFKLNLGSPSIERVRNDSGDYDPLSTDENNLSEDDSPELDKNNELTIIKISGNTDENPQVNK